MALSSKGGGGGGRGRPYGVMLLLAFGAAVLGVMVLHKLRERRIFTLLIQDKDNDLMTLHLLLQRERESGKEMKRKLVDLKEKANFLRAQKTELSNKLANLQSVTSSLREEQIALESTIEEKQTEIKMLREKEVNSSSDNSQISALTELLKQKEAEIEDMKHVIEKSNKIWSVSTDDPSNNPNVNKQSEESANLEDGKGSIENSSNPNPTTVNASSLVQSVNSTNLEGEGGHSKIVGVVAEKTDVEGGQIESEIVDKVNSNKGEGENVDNVGKIEGGESKHVLKLRKLDRLRGIKPTRGGRRKIISREMGSSGNGGVEGDGKSGIFRRKEVQTNSLKVDKESEISGERNSSVFEHSNDEGLRTNSEKDENGEVTGRDQGLKNASYSEENKGSYEDDDFSYKEKESSANATTTDIVETVDEKESKPSQLEGTSDRNNVDEMERTTDKNAEQEKSGVSEAAVEEANHEGE